MKKLFTVLLLCIFQAGFACAEEAPSPQADKHKAPEATDAEPAQQSYYEYFANNYEKWIEGGQKAPSDAYNWAKEDFKKAGTFQYKIIDVSSSLSLEELTELLNKLGEEKWEVITVDEGIRKDRIYLKKRSKSYLSALPAKDVLKLLSSGMVGGGEIDAP